MKRPLENPGAVHSEGPSGGAEQLQTWRLRSLAASPTRTSESAWPTWDWARPGVAGSERRFRSADGLIIDLMPADPVPWRQARGSRAIRVGTVFIIDVAGLISSFWNRSVAIRLRSFIGCLSAASPDDKGDDSAQCSGRHHRANHQPVTEGRNLGMEYQGP